MYMVKGINRQVIVVKSPDPKLFDQAIFLLREEAFSDSASPEQVIRQARQAAESYLRRNTVVGRAATRLSPVACGAVGAVLASGLWVLGLFVL